MKLTAHSIKSLILACSVALAACGGGGDSNTDPVVTEPDPVTLSGTAAAGAALIGTVTVKGALGNTKSALIEADGNYNVDVTGLTAPYRLRAQGTVGGKTYKLHSYAEAADVGGNVNITPFTDLIIANAAHQIAENFFDSETDTSLDPAEVDAQEDALQAKLQDVLDALGVGTAIDLLNSTFSADHSGLDAALDIIQIESTSNNIVTITNLLDNSSISDDITDSTDTESFVVNPDDAETYTEAVSDNVAIASLFEDFSAAFVGGLPSLSDIEDYFADDFLLNDNTKGEFLTEITTDPNLADLGFSSISISNLDSTAGTATVKFNVVFGDKVDPETETWLAIKDATLGWQLLGDQRIVDIDTLSYHCNDYDATDSQTDGACGINTQIWDENFSNNGTGGVAIASATVSIIDGADSMTVKDVFYLGNPDYSAPGDVQIYNEASGQFQGDWRKFGTGAGQIDPAIFAVGDIIEYKIYTQDLDISTPSAPSITGTAVATYTHTVPFAPSVTPLYPNATASTLTALENFTLGNDLTIAWTLADGTVSNEVLLEISDSQGSRIEIWDSSFSASTTSKTIASSAVDSLAATAAGLDSEAESYQLLVRIYATDALTGQFHSSDYRTTIPGPGASSTVDPVDPPVSTLVCGYQSGWDDTADGGLGEPITPNSFADFETVLADCDSAQAFTAQDVAGNSFTNEGETTTFNSLGSANGTQNDRGTGVFNDNNGFVLDFEWYVEAATCSGCTHNYLVLYSDSMIDADLPANHWIRETSAITGIAGSSYSKLTYSEGANFSDTDRATGSDGEIWNSTDVLL